MQWGVAARPDPEPIRRSYQPPGPGPAAAGRLGPIMRIDFVSDVACPWCAVGLHALERALERLGGEVPVELHFQPYELNPDLGPEGRDVVEYLCQKYGKTR